VRGMSLLDENETEGDSEFALMVGPVGGAKEGRSFIVPAKLVRVGPNRILVSVDVSESQLDDVPVGATLEIVISNLTDTSSLTASCLLEK
jgi:hypothetical protein